MIDVIGAVARLGAILLPVNFRLNAEEIGYVLADGAPVLVVAGAEYQEFIAALKRVATFGPELFRHRQARCAVCAARRSCGFGGVDV